MPETAQPISAERKYISHIILWPTCFLMNPALKGGGLMEVRLRIPKQKWMEGILVVRTFPTPKW